MMAEDPKSKLTTFIAEPIIDDKDPVGYLPGIDRNTEFPTPESVKYQLYLRRLGDPNGLNLKFARTKADLHANIMWSFERQSRQEASWGLREPGESQVQPVGALPVVPGTAPAKKRGILGRR